MPVESLSNDLSDTAALASVNSNDSEYPPTKETHLDETLQRWLTRCCQDIDRLHIRRAFLAEEAALSHRQSHQLHRSDAHGNVSQGQMGRMDSRLEPRSDLFDNSVELREALERITDEALRGALTQKLRNADSHALAIYCHSNYSAEEQKARVMGIYQPTYSDILRYEDSRTCEILRMSSEQFISEKPWSRGDDVDAVDWRLTEQRVQFTLESLAVNDKLASKVKQGFTKEETVSMYKSEIEALTSVLDRYNAEMNTLINDLDLEAREIAREGYRIASRAALSAFKRLRNTVSDLEGQKHRLRILWTEAVHVALRALPGNQQQACTAMPCEETCNPSAVSSDKSCIGG